MRLIKIQEVSRITSLSRSTIYKYMAEGQFPQSVKLSTHSVAWVEHEVMDWVTELVKLSRGEIFTADNQTKTTE